MGMEHLLNTASPSSGFIEEMRELEKLRTETMMKSCQSTTSRAGAIRCPVPRKSGRSYKEYDLTQDLSDFIMSKASPPYFTGSPPVRASNPLVHDTQFCAWKLQNVDQSLSIPIPTKGCNVRYCVREGSITKAWSYIYELHDRWQPDLRGHAWWTFRLLTLVVVVTLLASSRPICTYELSPSRSCRFQVLCRCHRQWCTYLLCSVLSAVKLVLANKVCQTYVAEKWGNLNEREFVFL